MKLFSVKFFVSFLILTAVFYGFSFKIAEAGGAVSVVNTVANFALGVGEVAVGTITNDSNLTNSGRCRLGVSSSNCPGGVGGATSGLGGTPSITDGSSGGGGSGGNISSQGTPATGVTPSVTTPSGPTPGSSSGSTSCGSLTYPSNVWHEIYTVHSSGQCLGERKEDTRWDFDVDWGNGIIDFNRSDDVELAMGRTINTNAGAYKFTLGSDDGSRLYIDGELCIDNWGDHGYKEENCTKFFSSGNHSFRINYYENGGGARINFKTEAVSIAPDVNLSVFPSLAERDAELAVSWSVANKAESNPSSCSASGDWSGSKSTDGGREYVSTSGRRGDYNFTLTCSGPGGSGSKTVSAKVLEFPKCSFSASKSEIEFAPDYSMLSWSCKYASSCSIDQGIGGVSNISGSKKVSPANTAAYTLSCSGQDGSRSYSTSVKVKRPGGVKYQEF
jgi:hypothetical protein